MSVVYYILVCVLYISVSWIFRMIIFDHIVCIHLGKRKSSVIYINQCVPYTTHTRILNIMLKKRDLDLDQNMLYIYRIVNGFIVVLVLVSYSSL